MCGFTANRMSSATTITVRQMTALMQHNHDSDKSRPCGRGVPELPESLQSADKVFVVSSRGRHNTYAARRNEGNVETSHLLLSLARHCQSYIKKKSLFSHIPSFISILSKKNYAQQMGKRIKWLLTSPGNQFVVAVELG
jgi:hypothetical protein